LGKLIKPRRDNTVVIIKVGYRVGTPDAPLSHDELNATHGDGW
jgi:aryl-alcohol dehydrogenase-like predicted oxidoreductase